MEIRVSPTRMELLRLKKRLTIARRGHKLLKDKFDELMKKFLKLIEENKQIRQEVEGKLADAYSGFAMAKAVMSPAAVEASIIVPGQQTSISAQIQRILSIEAPKFTVQNINEEKKRENNPVPYAMATTSGELDQAVILLGKSYEALIKLAEVEKTVELMAAEIEKTRRRVNALEYVLIPQLSAAIKFITMKLEENERGNLTRLMKVKDIVRAK